MTQAKEQPWLRWRPGRLAKNGGALLCWMFLRATAQASIVLVLARELGAHDYGQVIAVIAVASFLVPLTGLGLSHALLRNAARDPEHESVYFARALLWWWRTLLPCIAVAFALALILLPNVLPLSAMCAAITAEVAATSLTDVRARHRQAQHRIHAFGALNAGLPLFRLAAVGLLVQFHGSVNASIILWAYAASGLAYVALLLRAVPVDAGAASAVVPESMTAISGLSFSSAALASKLQAEFNKPVLAQSSFSMAGSYNVAQRVMDIASLPLFAIQEALWPRLHAQRNPKRQLGRMGFALITLALMLGALMWLLAPLLPTILGESFAEAADLLRFLAWLPMLQALRALLNFLVIHQARMPWIACASAVGALLSVLGVAALVPKYGATGAVVTAYLSEFAIIAVLLGGTIRGIKK